MIERDELNLDDPNSAGFRPTVAEKNEELVAMLDPRRPPRAAHSNPPPTSTCTPSGPSRWAAALFQRMQRYMMIANGVFSHLAHHRGQLSVYLRLNEAKVPAMYGPSADEAF